MNYAEFIDRKTLFSSIPTSGKMLDDLTIVFGSTQALQLKISELIVASSNKWRMEAVADLWLAHCWSVKQ